MTQLRALFLVSTLILLLPAPVSALPEIDGRVTPSEWKNAELHVIELNTGIEVNFSIIYTTDFVYYLAAIDHSREVDEINLDPSEPHDYFGIEFDNNNDGAIMGTPESPDDTILVNYKENRGADMFMHSFKAFYDEDFGGTNDVLGKAGSDGKNLYFEIAKPTRSSDSAGHDFDLLPGTDYQIMIAFWDDQPPHSANAGFNTRVDNDNFLTLTVNGMQSQIVYEIVTIIVLVLSLAIAYLISENGLEVLVTKMKAIVSKH